MILLNPEKVDLCRPLHEPLTPACGPTTLPGRIFPQAAADEWCWVPPTGLDHAPCPTVRAGAAFGWAHPNPTIEDGWKSLTD